MEVTVTPDNLIKTLRDRGISLTRDDIQWAFDSSRTKDVVSDYVRAYLGPATLLTAEEMHLYAMPYKTSPGERLTVVIRRHTHLEHAGQARKIAADNDLSTFRPFADAEFGEATMLLERSTAAIREQTRRLNVQRRALRDIQAKNHAAAESRERRLELKTQHYRSEAQQLAIATEELAQTFTAGTRAAQQQSKSNDIALHNSVYRMLKTDDRAISRYEHLLVPLTKFSDGPSVPQLRHQAKSLGNRLVQSKVVVMRHRLDRIFLQTIDHPMPTDDRDDDSDMLDDELQALREDLEALYSELKPVAEMSVDEEYLRPLLTAVSAEEDGAHEMSISRMSDVQDALACASEKVDILTGRVKEHTSHQQVIRTVSELAADDCLTERKDATLVPGQKHHGQFQGNGGIRPPAQIYKASRSTQDTGPSSETTDPVSRLLKIRGILLSSEIDKEALCAVLVQKILERRVSLTTHQSSLEKDVQAALASHFRDADEALQSLMDCFDHDSLVSTAPVLGPALHTAVAMMEGDVEHIGEQLSDIEDFNLFLNNRLREDRLRTTGCTLLVLAALLRFFVTAAQSSWTPVVLKNVKILGLQRAPNVTDVSRDGGHSILINGHIVWLYDDTECISVQGEQLSFVSNTAAYAHQPQASVKSVEDFGVVNVRTSASGLKETAILADHAVGTGGWIPFVKEELRFNEQREGRQRIAIWPGSSPTPVNRTFAYLFAPLVYVDSKPQDPAKKYVPRGMTLISITAPDAGPRARRVSELLFADDAVPFGGFAAVLGSGRRSQGPKASSEDRELYVLGVADGGLQIARVLLGQIQHRGSYDYFDTQSRKFVLKPPKLELADPKRVYLPGTFTSGNVFYSPYFKTFIMIYFNRMVDSTFYIRFLDLRQPLEDSRTWKRGGLNGRGITAEDAEALVRYRWSSEQVLWVSPPGTGGFNYAGAAHPEYFNRQYYPASRHFADEDRQGRLDKNEWYGSSEVAEKDAKGDGRHLLLSWTTQEGQDGDDGIYRIMLARIEFDDVPPAPPQDVGLQPADGTEGESGSKISAASDGLLITLGTLLKLERPLLLWLGASLVQTTLMGAPMAVVALLF
ncbi:MAG: hypothetical protein M1817_001279 [Caeruleum heppii]|nr:MAG: hypothetical protein M1817_001279 [Caeruleum heppii]